MPIGSTDVLALVPPPERIRKSSVASRNYAKPHWWSSTPDDAAARGFSGRVSQIKSGANLQEEGTRFSSSIGIQTQWPHTVVTSAPKVIAPGISDLLFAGLDEEFSLLLLR